MEWCDVMWMVWGSLHVLLKLLQVVVLLCDLLAEVEELLLLAHADGVVFVCLFAFGEGVTVCNQEYISLLIFFLGCLRVV
jgi:hypothetical protein